jgi:phage baseplate assembly protein W
MMSADEIRGSYLGTGWGFPPVFDRRHKSVRMVTEEDDIRESLHILLSTTPGERIMYPAYGCGLKTLAFSNMNTSDITVMKDMIERAILSYEPRINLVQVNVDTDLIHEGLIRITLNYSVRATNNSNNMVYPFYFQKGINFGS